MTHSGRHLDSQVKRILDSLKVTPQQLLDHPADVARGAVSTVDNIEPDLVRPSLGWWPLSWFWRINLDTLNTGLRNELDPLGVGYCYMLKSRGRLVHGRSSRWAQRPDDGSVGWAFHVPMNICSVSKFITAIATVSLLRSLGISARTPISSYLPDYWNPGAGVGAITFRHLLRHESGLGGSLNVGGTFSPGPGDFVTARGQVELGSSGTGTADYKNLNFTLLRVLFATLTGTLEPDFDGVPTFLGISEDTFWDFASAAAYRNYVNDTIFTAAAIAPREFKADDVAAKAYGTPPTSPGARLEDVVSDAGSSGWHLSIGELARLLNEFRRGGSMMSPRRAEQLLSDLYGLDGADDTRAGPVYRKNGRYNDGGSNTMDTAIYLMPKGVELSIFVNSGPGSGPNQPTYLARIPQIISDSVELGF
jgi:CubicO group peptidase (beta-lactamase class C family)